MVKGGCKSSFTISPSPTCIMAPGIHFKGKLAHTFSTCFLESISYHLPMDKRLMAEKKEKNDITHAYREKKINSGNPINVGFPTSPLVTSLDAEFLCCLFNLCDSKIKRKKDPMY